MPIAYRSLVRGGLVQVAESRNVLKINVLFNGFGLEWGERGERAKRERGYEGR